MFVYYIYIYIYIYIYHIFSNKNKIMDWFHKMAWDIIYLDIRVPAKYMGVNLI